MFLGFFLFLKTSPCVHFFNTCTDLAVLWAYPKPSLKLFFFGTKCGPIGLYSAVGQWQFWWWILQSVHLQISGLIVLSLQRSKSWFIAPSSQFSNHEIVDAHTGFTFVWFSGTVSLTVSVFNHTACETLRHEPITKCLSLSMFCTMYRPPITAVHFYRATHVHNAMYALVSVCFVFYQSLSKLLSSRQASSLTGNRLWHYYV